MVHEDNKWNIQVVPEDEAAPTASRGDGSGGGALAAASEGALRLHRHPQLPEGLHLSHVRPDLVT